MRLVKIILIIFLFFLAVTFSLQNTEEVSIHYYGLVDTFNAPLFSVLLAALFLGVIIGAVGGLLTNIRLRIELRRQTKEAERLRKEPESLQDEAFLKPDLPLFPPTDQ